MKTPFQHIDAIIQEKKISYFDELSDEDRKTFNVYIINLGLSMNPSILPIVNEANKYWEQLGAREIYLYYSQLLPKKKQYNKWIKGKNEEKYSQEIISSLVEYFQASEAEIIQHLNIFYQTEEGLSEVKRILRGLGWSDKQLKKVKL